MSAHIRLALHLVLALGIYAYLLWIACGLLLRQETGKENHPARGVMRQHGWTGLALLAVTISWGAMVAGLKAGWVYNTFPLMDGEIVPAAAWTIRPLWINFFDNAALVQFMHRVLAIGTAGVLWTWCWRLLRNAPSKPSRRWAIALAHMLALQLALGIATLLTHANIVLAALHQAGAILTLTLVIVNLRQLYPDKV